MKDLENHIEQKSLSQEFLEAIEVKETNEEDLSEDESDSKLENDIKQEVIDKGHTVNHISEGMENQIEEI